MGHNWLLDKEEMEEEKCRILYGWGGTRIYLGSASQELHDSSDRFQRSVTLATSSQFNRPSHASPMAVRLFIGLGSFEVIPTHNRFAHNPMGKGKRAGKHENKAAKSHQ